MEGPNDKSGEVERRTSLRDSFRRANLPTNDDDYDSLAMGISDGFRPAEVAQHHNSSHVPRPTMSSLESSSAHVAPPRPSSISKPHGHHQSLTLRHDGSLTDSDSRESTPIMTATTPNTSQPDDVESSYDGPSGPSHPYQMYPQDVRLARTASLATTSTDPMSERSYRGPLGPTHPYQMYPQNTLGGANAAGNHSEQRNFQIGFSGTTDGYERRIGPDGEEVADMIGPDGHTEQLPPYSRYPDEAYQRKALGIGTPRPSSQSQPEPHIQSQSQPTIPPTQPILSIPGAGGIGRATRNPEFESSEDLGDAVPPESRRSMRSFNSEASHHEINTAALEVTDEKPRQNWKTVAKKRVWGVVPCWALVLAIFVLVMMGVVLGAVIGTLFGPRFAKGPPRDKPPFAQGTPISFDPNPPYPTIPPGLPPLPEGTFGMYLMNMQKPSMCLRDATLQKSWNCNIIPSQLAMTITRQPKDVPETLMYSMSFSYNDTYTTDRNVYTYGMQPPDMTNLRLRLVDDTFEMARGPAWFFDIPYNKTVIIPEEFLVPPAPPAIEVPDDDRRRMESGGGFIRKAMAQSGERPWICYWDQTILEVFIYADQNSSSNRPIGANGLPSLPSSTPTSDGTEVPTPVIRQRGNIPGSYNGGGPQFAGPAFPTGAVDPVPTTATAPASSTVSGTDYLSNPPMPLGTNPAYPRMVKMEERRDPGFAQSAPWCRKYEVPGDGEEARPVKDEFGNPIDVVLIERDGDYETDHFTRRDEYQLDQRSFKNLASDMTDCGCMWWLT